MNINDELITELYTSLGLLRVAKIALEKAGPQAPNARQAWHEALKLLQAAITEQWKYTDLCISECFPVGKKGDGQ